MGQWTQRCSSQHLKLSQGHMWKRDVLPACVHCTALYICALTLKKYLRLEGPTQQCVKVVSGIKQWFTEVTPHTHCDCAEERVWRRWSLVMTDDSGCEMEGEDTGRDSLSLLYTGYLAAVLSVEDLWHICAELGFVNQNKTIRLCHYFVKFCIQIASERNRIEKTKS